MQVLPMDTARKIIAIMMGGEEATKEKTPNKPEPQIEETKPEALEPPQNINYSSPVIEPKTIERSQPQVEVNKATFQPLHENTGYSAPKNIDLILDVPLGYFSSTGKNKKEYQGYT